LSGIYLHIPFCKKICYYCDFYKTAALDSVEKTVINIAKELELRKNYLNNSVIETIYFGGGTPSVLNINQLKYLLSTIKSNFIISDLVEITLEANPEDLTYDYLHLLKSVGINRLSIGVQSFCDSDLKFMNRRHSAQEAIDSVHLAQNIGYQNISIDIIYGMSFSTTEQFIENIKKALTLDIQHISAYHLSIEERTTFNLFYKKGKLKQIEDEISNEQFYLLRKILLENEFQHYEISNFCKNGFISKHNSNYWKQVSYLGVGPSAHSYNLTSRQWNTANLVRYNKALDNNTLNFEKEDLNPNDKFNDYVITALRTSWGIRFDYLKSTFPDYLVQHFLDKMEKLIQLKQLKIENNSVVVTPEAIFLTDTICGEFIYA